MVTGSSRGLGRAIVEGLLERGELVSATARNTGDLEGLKAQFGEQVRVAALDVTRSEDAKRVVGETVQTFGRLDVVVNNAGYGVMGAFEEQTPE
jgi:NAD(P)-dependent dehydrogenase (short-subunit alcohol dehydrogenase family)